MEFVMPILEGAWRYVLTLRVSDYLDIALMAYAIYWLLKLVGTSKVESVGKVILLFLLALMLSDAFSLNGMYFLLSHILSLGTLALEDVQGSETLTYDILIPDGVNNLSGITSATLTISSGDISTKEVEATHFSYENFSGDHTVTVVTSSLPVTLRGSASDLEAIYGSEVHVIADLSDIAADSGSYTVPARIEVSGYDVGAVGTYEVTVHIS